MLISVWKKTWTIDGNGNITHGIETLNILLWVEAVQR